MAFAASAFAQSTSFTYQGKLNDGGVAANGDYDLLFFLYDAPTGGNSMTPSGIFHNSYPVINGIFTVTLNFGEVFPGPERWLEVRVRQTGAPVYTVLSPRQRITSAPYAVKSLLAEKAGHADNADTLENRPASDFVLTDDPRMSDERQPASGSGNYIQNTGTQQAGANFNISGSGTAGGTLSGNTVNSNAQFTIGGIHILSKPGSNTFVGQGAGTATVGTDNVFVGLNAGTNNTTGSSNAFFGRSAGQLNQTGSLNSFFGRSAGQNNTTGANNSFFGRSAGENNTTGAGNSFFGTMAGSANTTGSNNAFFGRSAGESNETGFLNSFFGMSAGQSNTAGAGNSFFGSNAGLNNTTGGQNSFFGAAAGAANTGSDNSFFGYSAGLVNTAGGQNSFFGTSSGQSNTAGGGNSFFGMSSGQSNTVGAGNSFFGRLAGRQNETGSFNAFFGESAGQNNTTGSGNSYFGAGTDTPNGSGSNNTVIGSFATNGEPHMTSSNNTVIGASASIEDNGSPSFPSTLSNNNTAIGAYARVLHFGAGPGNDGIENATAIGYRAVAWDSNVLILGSIAGINGADTTVRVGIGTPRPYADSRLDVQGTVRIATLGEEGSHNLCRNSNGIVSACSSSLRYKSNVSDFRSGVDLLSRLRPVTFNWNSSGMADMGLVAEEVAEIEPLLATYNEKGEVEGVKYDRIGVVLVNVVKEQQQTIDDLKKRLEQMTRLLCKLSPEDEICKEQ